MLIGRAVDWRKGSFKLIWRGGKARSLRSGVQGGRTLAAYQPPIPGHPLTAGLVKCLRHTLTRRFVILVILLYKCVHVNRYSE